MQYFRDYPLHKQIVEQFKRNIENKKLAHSFLFYGPEGSGKNAFALELAKAHAGAADAKNPPAHRQALLAAAARHTKSIGPVQA